LIDDGAADFGAAGTLAERWGRHGEGQEQGEER
jgi:hypothetical protein